MDGVPNRGSEVVRAPAKLTVTLRITGVREDGYHLIDAEMVELELADVLRIDPGAEGIEVTGPYRTGVPTDAGNLVSKALTLSGRRARVVIDKQIPSGGGLGGGSADAAAVLRWAGWTDLPGAAALGADVPFCLLGGRARVQGIGEVLDPLPARAETFTLVVPPLHVSTPTVYRCWDDMHGPRADGANDLEPAAIAVEPRLAWYRDQVRAVVGLDPTLAGSGATWFVRGAHPELAEALPDARVVVTQAAVGGPDR